MFGIGRIHFEFVHSIQSHNALVIQHQPISSSMTNGEESRKRKRTAETPGTVDRKDDDESTSEQNGSSNSGGNCGESGGSGGLKDVTSAAVPPAVRYYGVSATSLDDAFAALGDDKNATALLSSFNLSGVTMNADEATQLAAALIRNCNEELQYVDFHDVKIDDAGAVALAEALTRMNQMDTLTLNFDGIGEVGAMAIAKALKSMEHVETLSLQFKPIGITPIMAVSIASAISSMSELSILDISGNKIDCVGATAFAVALNHSENLIMLYISDNHIGDVGACALAEALKNTPNMGLLRLDYNYFGDVGACAIASALETLSDLLQVRAFCHDISDVGAIAIAESVANLTMIEELGVGGGNVSDAGAKAVAASVVQVQRSLTHFDFHCSAVGDDGAMSIADALSRLPNLTAVVVFAQEVTDIGAIAIAGSLKAATHLTTLRLYMYGTGNDFSIAIAALRPLWPRLQELILETEQWSDKGYEAIALAFRRQPGLIKSIDYFGGSYIDKLGDVASAYERELCSTGGDRDGRRLFDYWRGLRKGYAKWTRVSPDALSVIYQY
jgi:hypothetical protein